MRASAGRVADPRLFVNCSLHGSPAPGEARRASWPAYLPTPRDRNRPNSRYGNVFFLFFFSWLIRKKKKKRKLRSRFEKKKEFGARWRRAMLFNDWSSIRVLDFNFCRIEACFSSTISEYFSPRPFFGREIEREKKKRREEKERGR